MSGIWFFGLALRTGYATSATARRAARRQRIVPICVTWASAGAVLPLTNGPIRLEWLDRLLALRNGLANHVQLWLRLRVVRHSRLASWFTRPDPTL